MKQTNLLLWVILFSGQTKKYIMAFLKQTNLLLWVILFSGQTKKYIMANHAFPPLGYMCTYYLHIQAQ